MKKNILVSLITLVLCSIVFLCIYTLQQNKKIAWVNITKVYNEFTLKKELETKAISIGNRRKAIIDSAEFDLKSLSREIKSENGKDKTKISLFEVRKQAYFETKKQLEEDNAAMQQQYNEQILIQLNQYIKDYGKSGNYEYILSGDGSGSLMYAVENNDVTADVIQFVNEKYKGKLQ